MSSRQFPFPFIGVDRPDEVNLRSITVRFIQSPDSIVFNKISALAPDGAYADPEELCGLMMILNAFAATEETMKTWLLQIHEECAIEIAVREPSRAKWKNFQSPWQRYSIDQLPGLYSKWCQEDVSGMADEEFFQFTELLEELLDYYPEGYARCKHFLLHHYVFDLLFEKKKKDLAHILLKDVERDSLFEQACNGLINYSKFTDDSAMVVFAITHLMRDSRFLPNLMSHNRKFNHLLLKSLVEEKQFSMLERIKKTFSNVDHQQLNNILHPIYLGVHAMRKSKQWEVMIALYEFIISLVRNSPCEFPDPSFYCNVLWVLQNDNTGLPVNAARNVRFLEVCLPYAPGNPAIFYNAACLYNEMGEFENAVHCITDAVDSGLKGEELETMIFEIQTSDVFDSLRQRNDMRDLMVRLRNKK